jgi:hypothetical protein
VSRLEDAAVISGETCGLRTHRLSLSDEFANVLETFGVRGLDEIGSRYRALGRVNGRSLVIRGRSGSHWNCIADFDGIWFDLGVVSLDRATQPLALPRLSAISAPCTSAGRMGMPEPRAMNIAVFMEEVMRSTAR